MTSDYIIGVDDTCDNPSVIVNYKTSLGGYLSAFLVIEIDDEDTPSPFKNVDDAKLFAEIMVKLLDKIGDNNDG